MTRFTWRIAPHLCLMLAAFFLATAAGVPEERWILIRHQDYFRQKLLFDWPGLMAGSSPEARLTVVQPHGFSHPLTAVATREKDMRTLEVEFLLLD